MVQTIGWDNFAFDYPEVTADVGVVWLRDEGGMTFGIDTCFVYPGVQRSVVDVMNLLGGCDVVIQLDSIGAATTESVTWVEGVAEFELCDISLDVVSTLFQTGPLTFPHFNNVVATSLN